MRRTRGLFHVFNSEQVLLNILHSFTCLAYIRKASTSHYHAIKYTNVVVILLVSGQSSTHYLFHRIRANRINCISGQQTVSNLVMKLKTFGTSLKLNCKHIPSICIFSCTYTYAQTHTTHRTFRTYRTYRPNPIWLGFFFLLLLLLTAVLFMFEHEYCVYVFIKLQIIGHTAVA